MEIFNKRHYVLDKPFKSIWAHSLSFIKSLVLFPKRILSLLLSRTVSNIALGPNEIKTQKPINLVHLTDDKNDNGLLVINVLPKETFKLLKDYLLIFSSNVFTLPYLSGILKRQLTLDSPEDKEHIDQILNEIGLILLGQSQNKNLKDKKFAIEDIHIKGLEGLDEQLSAYFHQQLTEKYGEQFHTCPRTLKLDFYSLETSDCAVLDSVEVSTEEEQKKPISERRFVISCMARNQNYINWIKDFNYSAQNIGCSVIGFNYRGMDYSKGMIWTQDHLINDAIAQAGRLMDLGVKPEHIAFEGTSLGGAVATLAAAKMHEEGLKVKLYNERSFRSITRLITGFILPEKNSNPWNPLNWLKYIAFGFAYTFVAPLIWIIGWHMDAASAWDKIPMECKEYTVARNHTHPEKIDDDEFVSDSWASIRSKVEEHKNRIREKKNRGGELSAEEQKVLADKSKKHQFSLDRDEPETQNKSAHSAPRRFFSGTYSGANLHDYMARSLGTMLNSGLPASSSPT